jgi:predicted nucleic acid-binding protein
MKRIFVDNDIVLDLLAKRHPHFEAASGVFTLADKGKIILSVSPLTFANTHYILSKQLSAIRSREILSKLRILVNILPITAKTIEMALNDAMFKDFEDAIQYHSALENGQDIILTRNLNDFKKSILPVMTASDFISTPEIM